MLQLSTDIKHSGTVTIFKLNHDEIELLFEEYKKAESLPARKAIIEKLLTAELESMEEIGLSI